MRIALFVTCLTDTLFPEAGKAVVALLERLGHQVDFPMAQTCCGQMHFNTGYQREVMPLVRGFAAAFGDADVIVTPSASCASMVREYHPHLAGQAGDPGLARAVTEIAGRVHELSGLLTGVLGVTDVGAYFPHRVTYHPSCHSLRLLRVGDAPLRLLRAVGGIDLADLPAAETCCGFGGTFSLKNPDVSAAMCADKVAAIQQTRAEVVCAADSSCLMHIGGALTRQRAGVATMHLAEILASTEERPARPRGPAGAGGAQRRPAGPAGAAGLAGAAGHAASRLARGWRAAIARGGHAAPVRGGQAAPGRNGRAAISRGGQAAAGVLWGGSR
jgi:L-lactate dehydrogenase complex protein LldE